MEAALTRRQALIGATAGLLAAGWPRLAPAQAAAGALTLTDLGPDLVLVSGAGANVVVLATADGLLLVDGGAAQHSAALERVLAQRWPGRRVEVLFNSNWREEHTGANLSVRAAGATVMAHENTKLWLGGDFFVEWEDRHYTPRPAAELPNKTFYKSGSVDLGGRRVEYWYVPRAHTDGDIAVFFGDANLLVASDLLSVGRYPVPDYATGGWIGGLVDASRKLLDTTDARTRIVAASGGIYGRAELEAQHEMCTAVRQQAAQARSPRHARAGKILADPRQPAIKADQLAYEGIVRRYEEHAEVSTPSTRFCLRRRSSLARPHDRGPARAERLYLRATRRPVRRERGLRARRRLGRQRQSARHS